MTEPAAFDTWAIVELFGHNVIAGRVSEQTIGGAAFIRVDVPEVDGLPAFTKFYGGAAVYAITPCGEAEARVACAGLRVRPVQPYIVPGLSLPDAEDADGDEYRYPRRTW